MRTNPPIPPRNNHERRHPHRRHESTLLPPGKAMHEPQLSVGQVPVISRSPLPDDPNGRLWGDPHRHRHRAYRALVKETSWVRARLCVREVAWTRSATVPAAFIQTNLLVGTFAINGHSGSHWWVGRRWLGGLLTVFGYQPRALRTGSGPLRAHVNRLRHGIW